MNFDGTGKTVAQINDALRAHGIFGGKDISDEGLGLGQSALYCVTEMHTAADIRRACRRPEGGAANDPSCRSFTPRNGMSPSSWRWAAPARAGSCSPRPRPRWPQPWART